MMLEHQEDFPLDSVTLYDNDEERQAVIGEALEILNERRGSADSFCIYN